MQAQWERQIKSFLIDVRKYKFFVVIVFSIVSLALLTLGVYWPKVYESKTTVLVDDSNIIRPLMEGAAPATDIRDRAGIAREVIFGRKIMDQILAHGGWSEDGLTPLEQEEIIEGIRQRTTIQGGKDLILISYRDQDPERAYTVTARFADLFIAESIYQKITESQDALDFIDNRVGEYRDKLQTAEQGLKEFRSANPDVRPGSEREVGGRIDSLRASNDSNRVALRELEIRKGSLRSKLSGEADLTESFSRRQEHAERLSELRSQLDLLRLSYTDAYPDIVSLKRQIADLEQGLLDAEQKDAIGEGRSSSGSESDLMASRANPLYEELRGQLSETETEMETLTARIAETEALLLVEEERAKKIYGMEAQLAELTRDYEVNQDVYQDLLRKRENARVSNNMDREEQGLTLKIQEPASLPLKPGGFRFLHFMTSGLLLGLCIPLGLIYMKIMVDPRVRFDDVITERLALPVLCTIPHYTSPKERKFGMLGTVAVALVVVGVLATYAAVGLMHVQGAL